MEWEVEWAQLRSLPQQKVVWEMQGEVEWGLHPWHVEWDVEQEVERVPLCLLLHREVEWGVEWGVERRVHQWGVQWDA
jgi:hypothetical protein